MLFCVLHFFLIEEMHRKDRAILFVNINMDVQINIDILIILLDPVDVDFQQFVGSEYRVELDLVAEVYLKVVDVFPQNQLMAVIHLDPEVHSDRVHYLFDFKGKLGLFQLFILLSLQIDGGAFDEKLDSAREVL